MTFIAYCLALVVAIAVMTAVDARSRNGIDLDRVLFFTAVVMLWPVSLTAWVSYRLATWVVDWIGRRP